MNEPLYSMIWHALFDSQSPWQPILLAVFAALIFLGLFFRKKISAGFWIIIGVIVQVLSLLFAIFSFVLAVQTNSLGGLVFIAFLVFPALCVWVVISIILFHIARKRRKEGLSTPLGFLVSLSGIVAYLIGAALLLFLGFLFLNAG